MPDAGRPRSAIILAAGLGLRLRDHVPDTPKGLLTLGGEPIIARSIRLLQDAGIPRVTLVVGYLADRYRAFAAEQAGVSVVLNDRFAESGSMASLAAALAEPDRAGGSILVLESDLVYERRALAAMLEAPAADATLVSGTTGAGDEVWVCAPRGRLAGLSKRSSDLPAITGEFVGITKLSSGGAAAMRAAFDAFVARHGHARMDYETDALAGIAAARPIAAVVVPDLLWGEIDDARQFERVRRHVWPALQ